MYCALQSPSDDSKVLIVAKDRLLPLADILGTTEVLVEFQGKFYKIYRHHINPHFFQGSDLVGLNYVPIFSSPANPLQPLKVISASHVTSESGTGLVHCAPAHGAEDYHAFLALGLISSANSMVCHVDGEGKFNAEVTNIVGDAAASLIGQDVLSDGSRAVVDLLRNAGSLVKVQRIKHRYPYDWKTNEPIIVTSVFSGSFLCLILNEIW